MSNLQEKQLLNPNYLKSFSILLNIRVKKHILYNIKYYTNYLIIDVFLKTNT